ncbi:MAG: ORF6N domain-containing protein [Elusimicrobia bacterium]|nr:ORF6N domain-containing protein [Elusimicrobiota bacterium]
MTTETENPAVLPLIRTIRSQRVILDSDLARLYGVGTKHLNQQIRRNQRRFPPDFIFRLTPREALMRSQFVTASSKRNVTSPPFAFTEHGAVMAANVLNSERAVVMSVEVVRAFIRLRRAVLTQEKLARKVADLERTVKERQDGHDKKIELLLTAVKLLIDGSDAATRKRIGFAV